MECVYLVKAKYLGDTKFYLEFNDGVKGEVDLMPIIQKYKQASKLKDEEEISNFYLDSWPTLAWKCGFDIAPETLYEKCKEFTSVD